MGDFATLGTRRLVGEQGRAYGVAGGHERGNAARLAHEEQA